MANWKEEEWEFCNDGVLLYRRRKRRLVLPQPPPPAAEQQPDPEAEEKNRRARKRRALTKLTDKYQKELDQWDHLSNSLRAMEDSAQQQQTLRLQEQEQEQEEEEEEEDQSLSAASPSGSSLVKRSMVDELLLKLEAEESIIRDLSNLCDISEALCDAQEEQLNQSLFDLPIWGSPRTLMTSLCDNAED